LEHLGLSPTNGRLDEAAIGLPEAREAAAVGRWKTDLTRTEITDIERELGDDLRLFGYELSVGAEAGPARSPHTSETLHA
jgi:hypothetical protein